MKIKRISPYKREIFFRFVAAAFSTSCQIVKVKFYIIN